LQEERRGNMWPSLKHTLPVMPGRAVAKIHRPRAKVLWVVPLPLSPRCNEIEVLLGGPLITFPVVPPQ